MGISALDKILDGSKKNKIVNELPSGIPWAPDKASMVVSTPREVYGIINNVPMKKILTITSIRNFLAKRYRTTIACPISTGIFIIIAARASEELRVKKTQFAHWWRILKADGSLHPKFPGGISQQKIYLENEGFVIKQVRKLLFVENYQEYLWGIPNNLKTKFEIPNTI